MKNTRRMIALCLAIVLMMSMAITASAASVSWTSGSYNYVATVTEGSAFIKYREMENSEVVQHTKGTRTAVYLYSSSFTDYASTSDFNTTFKTYLTAALNKTTNLKSSRTFSTAGITVYVEANKESGTYKASASITCKSASWNVQRNTTDLVDAGTLSSAPTSSCYYVARKTN